MCVATGPPATSADSMQHSPATRDALSESLFEVTDAIASFDWGLDRLKALHLSLNRSMKQEVEHLLTLDTRHAEPSRVPPTLISEDVS
jgi:hypothetical protein